MVIVEGIAAGSPAAKKRIAVGDKLLKINGHDIEDVLDYRFFLPDTKLKLELETAKGRRRVVRLRKDEYEEIGLEFSDYLMDSQHTCRNKCIFCFIDQMPAGMRDTLYVKDDDSRLSFLFGNYITLTNLTEHEISRIIEMHISPVNISVHTTDPELRCRMMNNRFAGDSLRHMRRLADAGIKINAQMVLCPGWNDGEALSRTMQDLKTYYPAIQSVAAVPVGLTKYREGLPELSLFTPSQAADVIDRMTAMGDAMEAETGVRLFYPSDEFYLLADRPLPEAPFYADFVQWENGVGMISLLREQFAAAMAVCDEHPQGSKLVIATGMLAAPEIERLCAVARQRWPELDVTVKAIKNEFFGESITVAGLVTGQDIINQLTGTEMDILLIPSSMLRHEQDLFLDDTTPAEVEQALGVKLVTVGEDGGELLDALLY
ncbi:MAG: DUF512 domain-containing protein [Clostridia bacterium]|nr:DUF512 domain-containing protein [Clostridia bacterium]